MNANMIEAAARAAHEVNRAWCLAHGDTSQVSWDDAPEHLKKLSREGVRGVLAGDTPEESHRRWSQGKYTDGWSYGATKDEAKKTHPCLVPYHELGLMQRLKDILFTDTVRSVTYAFKMMKP